MNITDLQNRYGYDLADQIQAALTPQEFTDLEVEELATFCELRAEKIYQTYQQQMDNTPIVASEREKIKESLQILRVRWQEAEELAYHVLAADATVGMNDRRALPGA